MEKVLAELARRRELAARREVSKPEFIDSHNGLTIRRSISGEFIMDSDAHRARELDYQTQTYKSLLKMRAAIDAVLGEEEG